MMKMSSIPKSHWATKINLLTGLTKTALPLHVFTFIWELFISKDFNAHFGYFPVMQTQYCNKPEAQSQSTLLKPSIIGRNTTIHYFLLFFCRTGHNHQQHNVTFESDDLLWITMSNLPQSQSAATKAKGQNNVKATTGNFWNFCYKSSNWEVNLNVNCGLLINLASAWDILRSQCALVNTILNCNFT